MLKIEAKGLNSLLAKIEKHKLLMHKTVTERKRRLVEMVLTDLVQGSPQWSGNLASNWYIEFHGNTGSYSPIGNYSKTDWKTNPHYERGADPAVSQTLARELPKLSGIRWNSKVQIVNYTPYAREVEQGIGPGGWKGIRPENYKYGQIAMAEYVKMKYSRLRNLRTNL